MVYIDCNESKTGATAIIKKNIISQLFSIYSSIYIRIRHVAGILH